MTRVWPSALVVRPLTPADGDVIAAWRYEGPWAVYDLDEPVTAEDGYLAVAGRGDGPLVGFCCAGEEARVLGLPELPGVLDVGLGMDPRWTGRGHGRAFTTTVLDHYRAEHPGLALRAVVQAWNDRGVRLVRGLGFTETGRHRTPTGEEYVVLFS